MSARGQKFTIAWKQPVYYQDFLNDFTKNPTTGILATVTNEKAINQAIENLVLTMNGERPGRTYVGSKVLSSMFDLGTPNTIDALQTSVETVIAVCEPRAENVSVTVTPRLMENAVDITVRYQPVNLPQVVEFSFVIQRVR